jgi:hypothetical protein
MYVSFGTISRVAALRRGPFAFRYTNALIKLSSNYKFRAVATSVSGRPASQTIEHAAINVKEEVGNSAADLAKRIAGGYLTSDMVAPAGRNETFVRFH